MTIDSCFRIITSLIAAVTLPNVLYHHSPRSPLETNRSPSPPRPSLPRCLVCTKRNDTRDSRRHSDLHIHLNQPCHPHRIFKSPWRRQHRGNAINHPPGPHTALSRPHYERGKIDGFRENVFSFADWCSNWDEAQGCWGVFLISGRPLNPPYLGHHSGHICPHIIQLIQFTLGS